MNALFDQLFFVVTLSCSIQVLDLHTFPLQLSAVYAKISKY